MAMGQRCWLSLLMITLSLLLSACHNKPLNNPHPKNESQSNILYSSFSERPKTLDPARSYSSNESIFTTQIYEPPLQYHYFKRPYELTTLTAETVPQPVYYDKADKRLPSNAKASQIAYTVYDIKIKPGIYFQPHPALAKDEQGQYRYHHLTPADIKGKYRLQDFKHVGSRELTAADYVYQIKRLAHPKIHSPILGLMSQYIVGLDSLAKDLSAQLKQSPGKALALRQAKLTGVTQLDRYTYRVKIKGKYPQFKYWLAMPFFAAMPWEADLFYSQPGLARKNITLDWYPIGTGPYQLTENNPNKEMILQRNPNFRGEAYPQPEDEGDRRYAKHTEQLMPFIDKVVFSLEKESIPRWNKFLQGYYDFSGISSDSYDQAIRIDAHGKPHVTPELANRGIQLQTNVGLSTFYLGFNMKDNIVGGLTAKARYLRQAISIALDYEDYISIFLNGRGIAAQGPLPPGIFGHLPNKQGINPYLYRWADNKAERLSLSEAKKLLVKAGYPNGINATTGKPLVLHYDTVASSGPDDKARFDWMRKQFAKLGIQLHIRATTYNRFQEKMRTGNAQLFSWGWMADYPDPENFLFLLYGPNGKVAHGGENAANYHNPEYDRLFNQMKDLPNGEQRQQVINKMLAIIHKDVPWVWGFHPLDFVLKHNWIEPGKISAMSGNQLKYKRFSPLKRAQARQQWNQAIWWPIGIVGLILIIFLKPIELLSCRREHRVTKRHQCYVKL